MLKQNLYNGKGKAHVQSILNTSVNHKSLFSKEKTRGIFDVDSSENIDLPSVHNAVKVKKNCFFEPENVNKEQNLYGVSYQNLFNKVSRAFSGYGKAKKYNTQRLPYLNKNKLKFYQFIIEENLDEDNEESEAEIFSVSQTPEIRSKFGMRYGRHSLDV